MRHSIQSNPGHAGIWQTHNNALSKGSYNKKIYVYQEILDIYYTSPERWWSDSTTQHSLQTHSL